MKKLLFFVLTAALMFGCKKDDNGTPCPVSGATLPTSSAENPIPAGSAVTIQGSGFTSSSEIWLRGVATKADGDVQATVTDRTSTSITFRAPSSVSGEQSVILKQDGGEWPLGKMYFTAAPEILPKKIVKSLLTEEVDGEKETHTALYTYDETGRLTRIETSSTGDSFYEGSRIEYLQDKIKISHDYDEVVDWEVEFLVENGRATNCIEEDKEDGSICETKEYTYSANGYLTGIVFSLTNEGITDTYTGELTVGEDGSLEKYTTAEKEIEDGGYYGTYTIDFTPNTSVPNNLNLDLIGNNYLFGDIIDDPAILDAYLLGIGGTRSKYLPKQLTLTDADGESFTVKYEYEFAGEYISKIGIDDGDGYTATLELFYEE
ncbi:IPT/TIG domain-containing protein [uncultured Rikenella sp.]|uniref:IPT/TIG domain-containing protein n=1 Tax=uncultured Rikenella sp. TaxID=368003 RepID=UPI0025DBE0E2|nr:IPT/TIG domain-containing protein [uncultured Rikenella sp.]